MVNIINVLVEVVIFASLIGVIASQASQTNENITGASAVLYGLITLFVIIGFVVALLKTMKVKGGR